MFGSERIAKIMDRLGIEEGEMIQHSMITNSIERAQKKVEENNFGIRKRLLEYDDVMNIQREAIYKKRRHALFGDRLAVDISNMIYDVCETTVLDYNEKKDFEGFELALLREFACDAPVDEKEFDSLNGQAITDKVYEYVYKRYRTKNEAIAQKTFPVISQVLENESRYENIAIPVTDGLKEMQVVANLRKAFADKGKEVALSIEKGITLSMIDNAWKEHLREMDDLKQSVQNASYEQKDPLLIYKLESFDLFKNMIDKVNREVVSFLMKGLIPIQEPEQVREAQARQRLDMSKYQTSKTDLPSYSGSSSTVPGGPPQPRPVQPVRVEKKIGRNDPCPCGSGKKYKVCHGRPDLQPNA